MMKIPASTGSCARNEETSNLMKIRGEEKLILMIPVGRGKGEEGRERPK